MNKYELYKEMRRELAEGYKREIEQAQSLLTGTDLQILNAGTALKLDDDASMAAQGEARKILREELSSTLKVILERYLRNLRTEASNHGIQLSSAEIATAMADATPSAPIAAKDVQPVPAPVQPAQASGTEAEDPFDTLIRDIEEEYVSREANVS